MKRLFVPVVLAAFLAGPVPAWACNWGDAQANITWVIDRDAGAQACFAEARRCQRVRNHQTGEMVTSGGCKDAFDAVMHCQRHNGGAQGSIRACESQTRQYLSQRGK